MRNIKNPMGVARGYKWYFIMLGGSSPTNGYRQISPMGDPINLKNQDNGLLPPRMKISVITNISIFRFYGYIEDISADILEKNIDTLKIVKNSQKYKENFIII